MFITFFLVEQWHLVLHYLHERKFFSFEIYNPLYVARYIGAFVPSESVRISLLTAPRSTLNWIHDPPSLKLCTRLCTIYSIHNTTHKHRPNFPPKRAQADAARGINIHVGGDSFFHSNTTSIYTLINGRLVLLMKTCHTCMENCL